jgi:FkbM family methyltransferase
MRLRFAQKIRSLLKKTLSDLGIVVLTGKSVRFFEANIAARQDLAFLREVPDRHMARVLRMMDESKAQLRQDLFVLSQLDFKQDGFFVEFGAANGRELSNSWLLEKKFGWTGILAEPARIWHTTLAENRSCRIDHRCVWSRTGETLRFEETDMPELSSLAGFTDNDRHRDRRRTEASYSVETVSLLDLLASHDAPPDIDYLSIDTEGSELRILESFDFSKHRFRVVTCEHNHGENRAKIADLLRRNGYRRVFETVSRFDDWFVHEQLMLSPAA